MYKHLFKALLSWSLLAPPLLCGNMANTIKCRAAAFFPCSDRMRDIYSQTIPTYEVEATFGVKDTVQAWANVGWLYKHGRSENLKSATSINMRSVSCGLSLVGCVNECLRIYLGAGYSMTCAQIKNTFYTSNTHCKYKERKYISGVVVKSGVLYDINCMLCSEAFLDYLYLPSKFHTSVSLGGLRLGIGLGYKY